MLIANDLETPPAWSPKACAVGASLVDAERATLRGGADPWRHGFAAGW